MRNRWKQWASEVERGEKRAIAKAISLVENDTEKSEILLTLLYPKTGNTYKIGIAGAPGVGKSSLIAQLVKPLTMKGERVAVIAVDPTSPFTGGALLGDRLRLQEQLFKEKVFMRSMASRGSLGGLSTSVRSAIRILGAAGFDTILVETVGSGQLQVDVVHIVDTLLLLLSPESGDVIQGMKAGLLEAADIFIINKADREGAEKSKQELSTALRLKENHKDWIPPILLTNSLTGQGIQELVQAIDRHREYLHLSGVGKKRQAEQIRSEIEEYVQKRIHQRIQKSLNKWLSAELLQRLERGEMTPYQVAKNFVAPELSPKNSPEKRSKKNERKNYPAH